MPLKIAIVGGGSYQWTINLVIDFALDKRFYGCSLILHDIDRESLDITTRVCRLIARKASTQWRVESSLDLEKALEGADVVIVQISTGGLESMRNDIEIPARYGIVQSVGDTVGPGGLSRALMNIPVILEIAQRMEDSCPQAWLLNLTNPMSTITKALIQHTEVKTVGLCHEVSKARNRIKEIFQLDRPNQMRFCSAGINHFTWITRLDVKGQDGLELLLRYHREGRLKPITDTATENPFFNRLLLSLKLLERYGALPSADDRHVAEFFPFFMKSEQQKRYGILLTTIDYRIKKRERSKQQHLALLSRSREPELSKSQEEISDLVSALFGGQSWTRSVNLPNRGQIANLPREAVVETMGVINKDSISPLDAGDLPVGITAWLHHHIINQELIVAAAVQGNKQLALQALSNDPLTTDFDECEQLLDEMLLANRRWLSLFF